MRTFETFEKLGIDCYENSTVNKQGEILYHLYKVDKRGEIKLFIKNNKNSAVIILGKSYAPELKQICILIKSANFKKLANKKDIQEFKELRDNFLKN